MTFMGSQTAGAVLWGFVADRVGLRPAILAAAVVVLAGVGAGLVWRVPETGHIDPQPAAFSGDPRVAFDPDWMPDQCWSQFISPSRRSGSRPSDRDGPAPPLPAPTGATSWELYRDGEHPDRFVEIFRVPSWEEHLRQHEGRLTGTDQVVEEAALAFSDPAVHADHLLPP